MLDRALCEEVFREAVIECDPAARVRVALQREPVRGKAVIGLAVGKAALAMARGAGEVSRGLVVTNADDGLGVPAGWRVMVAGHPVADERSFHAGAEAVILMKSADPDDVVLALISGGASALIEECRPGVSPDELRAKAADKMASGASIHELNTLRISLSGIKGGQLADRSKAPVVTLVVSDVIGDDPRFVGSGPTVRAGDRAVVIAPMTSFGEAVHAGLTARGIASRRIAEPLAGDVADVARRLAAEPGVVVAWGEPSVVVPDAHGLGGRAQQLALELAREIRGSDRAGFIAGSDGIDGPGNAAGAFVDGLTWDAVVDPEGALARCDAGTALAAVGALVITGPTGINHADVMIVG
jgi:hydroxypyruvate reductase